MIKVILDVAVTLDGFIEGPDGEIDWIVADGGTDFGDILTGVLEGIDTIFYGRVSYDMWGNYQPPADASPSLKAAWQLLHSKKKYVFSTIKKSDGTMTVISTHIKEQVTELKQGKGGNIWLYGGSRLVTTFLNLGLIDVFRLAVHPVILGTGKPLFKNIENRTRLHLREVKEHHSGVTLLTYDAI